MARYISGRGSEQPCQPDFESDGWAIAFSWLGLLGSKSDRGVIDSAKDHDQPRRREVCNGWKSDISD
jgi:hypothetical protein